MFLKCSWAIPARFRGECLWSRRRIGNHMLRVTFARKTIKGEYDIPDWWLEGGGMQPEVKI
jgi:hypothetical protein